MTERICLVTQLLSTLVIAFSLTFGIAYYADAYQSEYTVTGSR